MNYLNLDPKMIEGIGYDNNCFQIYFKSNDTDGKKILITDKEKDYILTMLKSFEESLVDIEYETDEELQEHFGISKKDVKDEKDTINSLRNKLNW